MKTTLITGASGFIGRHCLAPLVQAGCEVHAVSREAADGNKNGVVWHRADLLDSGQIRRLIAEVKPSALLHLAWDVTPGRYANSSTNLGWGQATLELSLAFAEHGGQRAVFAGTCFEYDPRFGYCTENLTPLCPTTLYGTVKDATQRIVMNFARQAGFTAAWARVFHLYGPFEPSARFAPTIIRGMLSGERVRLTHGRQVRDFLHVSDVADALVAVLNSNVEGPVNIGSGEPIALRDLALAIASRVRGEDRLNFGAVESSPSDPMILISNVTRLRTEVSWSPRIALSNGIDETIEWWRRRLRDEEGGRS